MNHLVRRWGVFAKETIKFPLCILHLLVVILVAPLAFALPQKPFMHSLIFQYR